MIFDKATVIAAVKTRLTSAEKGKDGDIERAMSLCLDEMSMKLRSRGSTLSEPVTVAANTRSVVIDGLNADLRYIYALKYGDTVLTYYEPVIFMRDYDSSTAQAGTPTYWTQILSSSGYPEVKFDCPTLTSGTLTVYYLPNLTPGTISTMRSAAPVVAGTLAYLWGPETERGLVVYQQFKDLIKSARASDNYLYNSPAKITRSKVEQDMESIRWNYRNRR